MPKPKKKPQEVEKTVAVSAKEFQELAEAFESQRDILLSALREVKANFQHPEIKIEVPLYLVPTFDAMAARVNNILTTYERYGL